MAKLIVTDRAGVETVVEATTGMVVMRILCDAGVGDIRALCGGHGLCGTCHAYIESGFLDRLAPMSDEESDLLDGVPNRRPDSRLTCQIPFDDALDGMHLTIAGED